MRVILVSLGIAFMIVLLQLWLKFLSRPTPAKKLHALRAEDFVWWIEWVVAASVSLVIVLIVASYEKQPIATTQVVLTTVTLFLGYSVLPWIAKTFAYDDHGKIRGWREAIAMNLFGMLILLSTVATGVKLYG